MLAVSVKHSRRTPFDETANDQSARSPSKSCLTITLFARTVRVTVVYHSILTPQCLRATVPAWQYLTNGKPYKPTRATSPTHPAILPAPFLYPHTSLRLLYSTRIHGVAGGNFF